MPDIENPQTYAEWFWKNSVDATELRAEHIEKTLSPLTAEIFNLIPDIDDIPPILKTFMDSLIEPSDPGFENVLVRFVSNVGTGLMNRVLGHEVKEFDYHMNSYLQNTLMEHPIANTLFLRKKVTPELWLERNHQAGFKDEEAKLIYESQKPYPPMADLISYARYAGEPTNPKEIAWSLFDISPNDWPLWEWLSRQKLTTEQVQSLMKRGDMSMTEADTELSRIGWQGTDHFHTKSLAWTVPNAMLMLQGELVTDQTREHILDSISAADIHPKYAETYMDAVLTKPATEDIIAFELRQDPMLGGLDNELRRIGVHPNYFGVYKELAYSIPPVADIITMAVREAFTPDIARRFGQYADLPPEYVEWVQKKGLTKEWAERYWAAHWTLPSMQQGFEMLHRGVIQFDDLNRLMRASDIMPFWRDKLTAIAYRPLTRVDVRRMFKLGVINENQVKKAYTDLGYNEYNAGLMTQFTIEWVKGTPRKLSTANIVTAYEKHLIEGTELQSQLVDAGTDREDIEPIIRTAQQRRRWSDKEDRINNVEFLYKQGKYTEADVTRELSNVGLQTDYINQLIPQWTAKAVTEKDSLWTTAQTLSFLKAGRIDEPRAIQELESLGYNAERITVYVGSAKQLP